MEHTTIEVFTSNEFTNLKRLVYDYEEENEVITSPPLSIGVGLSPLEVFRA
jgi:hypothetical protein